ncbi:MAG: N-acetyl-alpha-D-glucosaminyl L-malate synthase [Candidatus Anoxychlamydiales bacterium]|nr:N-acetyl-alpha-D-glucosaminyl L-malate synthase [Candidatus Anoxychlamydiales bacterium]
MKKQLNVLHLEASPGWGGQEMRILKESSGMKKLGFRIIIGVEKKGGLIEKAKKEKFLTYEIRFKKIFWIFSFFKLLYIMKKHKIDILNTHSSSDAWLGGIVAKFLKIPIIRTRHLSTPIKKGLNSKLLYGYLADFVVTTCKDAADKIIKQTKKDPKKCRSIPTGVNFEKIKVDPQDSIKFKKDFNIKESDFLVGTACFMRSWKGIDDFLKAAKILENEKNIKFLIIGGGHKDSYIKMAKDMNLKNVIFTDHLENPFPAINALDIFALLSTAHEGVSQASLQAIFLQKPIIATKTGGLKEVCIDKKTGIQVPIFSSKKVAEAIIKLQKDDKLRKELAKNAKELALKFSQDNMIIEMKKVYESIL